MIEWEDEEPTEQQGFGFGPTGDLICKIAIGILGVAGVVLVLWAGMR